MLHEDEKKKNEIDTQDDNEDDFTNNHQETFERNFRKYKADMNELIPMMKEAIKKRRIEEEIDEAEKKRKARRDIEKQKNEDEKKTPTKLKISNH